MTRKIEIVPYNPAWPQMFEEELARIRQVLGEHCLEIHHIGSTSVPGLSAKEDIDILCVVDDLNASLHLQDEEYTFKGEFFPLRYFFFAEYTSVESKYPCVRARSWLCRPELVFSRLFEKP